MITATTFYGDSDIEKNCHGLWTSQFKVSAMGHGGNTMGCTANLQFYSETGLGIVVMTNEQGETMFCTGFASLLFGDIRDSELVKNNPITEDYDISGIYTPSRNIVSGFAMATRYAGQMLTIAKTENADVFNLPIIGGMQMIHIGDKMWLLTSENGLNNFLYESADSKGNRQFEMMSTDYVQNNKNIIGTIGFFSFVIFGVLCLLIMVVKLIFFLIRKIMKKEKHLTKADKQIILHQLIQGVSGVILFLLIGVLGAQGYSFAVFSCIMVTVLGVISLVNGVVLVKNTLKVKEIRTSKKVKDTVDILSDCVFTFIM